MSRYQKFVVGMLAFLQFTIILDFMTLAPLGAVLMPALRITPTQFGLCVSVYAFSAAASGLLAAGFADSFDRKKFLLFFYSGFMVGTLLCGLASSYQFLLLARVVTGVFGGVLGSIVLAITTDLFALNMRGRVMGFVQAAFGASQVLGIPMGLLLSNRWGWHAPFLMIVTISALVGIVIVWGLRPIDAHLKRAHQRVSALQHLRATITQPNYLQAFAATALLATGGFMLMPFGSAFTVHNLGVELRNLPLIYLITGICAVGIGPLVGRAADSFGKFRTFVFGTSISITMVLIYTHLGVTPLPMVILVNVILFVGIFSRMIPAQTLMSAIPSVQMRGSFMSINAAVQQVSGGIASVLAGAIIRQGPGGVLLHFERLGYAVAAASIFSLIMMSRLHRLVPEPSRAQRVTGADTPAV